MCFSSTLETVPNYRNTAHTVQCTLTCSDIAALLFEETTDYVVRRGCVQVEGNTLFTSFHAILERQLDLIVWVLWFFFWHLSLWNSVWTTYREKRKTTAPSRLTTTARVLQERMKYPNKAYWAIPTAKNKPPIEPNTQLKTKQNIITSARNTSKSQQMGSDKN